MIQKLLICSCFLALSLHSTSYAIVIDSSAVSADITSNQDKNLIESIKSNSELSTFLQAVNAAGLEATLEEPGPYTVFAPSNEAFAAIPSEAFQDLLKKENKTKLVNILKNHVVKGKILTNSINTSNVSTLGGKPLHINVRGSQITVDNANIVEPDLESSNGVIQVIDRVLSIQQP